MAPRRLELLRVYVRADGARVAVLRCRATGATWRTGEARALALLALADPPPGPAGWPLAGDGPSV